MAGTDDRQVVARFDKCPCGSTDRMMARVASAMKAKGLWPEGLPIEDVGITEIGGPLIHPSMVPRLIVGGVVPGSWALIDCCLSCGTVYAIRITDGPVPIEIQQGPPPIPRGLFGRG